VLVLAAAFFQKFGLVSAFVALVLKYWHRCSSLQIFSKTPQRAAASLDPKPFVQQAGIRTILWDSFGEFDIHLGGSLTLRPAAQYAPRTTRR